MTNGNQTTAAAERPKIVIDFTKAHTVYKNAAGKRVPGVTTVLGFVNKPALGRWHNQMGLQGIDTERFVQEAANKGTVAHEMARAHVTGCEIDFTQSNIPRNVVDEAENAFIKFMEWWGEGQYELLHSEFEMVSERWQCGGTGDLFVRRVRDGAILYVDLKTSKGIYPEMKVQACAYAEMFKEATATSMDLEGSIPVGGISVDEVWIVRIGKEDTGDFEAVQVYNRTECVYAFECLLPTYRAFQKVK